MKKLKNMLIEMVIWLLQRNVLMQLHSFIYLLPKKVEHLRLTNEQYSKISELSFGKKFQIFLHYFLNLFCLKPFFLRW
jgi:hypothetical protein